jgi:hypothetical protein
VRIFTCIRPRGNAEADYRFSRRLFLILWNLSEESLCWGQISPWPWKWSACTYLRAEDANWPNNR